MLIFGVARMKEHFLIGMVLALAGCLLYPAEALADTITLDNLETSSESEGSSSIGPIVAITRLATGVASLPGSDGVSFGAAESFQTAVDSPTRSSAGVASVGPVKIADTPMAEAMGGAAQDLNSGGSRSASLNGAGMMFGASTAGKTPGTHWFPLAANLASETPSVPRHGLGREADRFASHLKVRIGNDRKGLADDEVPVPEPTCFASLGLGLFVVGTVGFYWKHKTSSNLA
jgi:hypothetical protein